MELEPQRGLPCLQSEMSITCITQYNSKKKNEAINDYIATAKKNIVLAEEILLSPYFNKVYENIREN